MAAREAETGSPDPDAAEAAASSTRVANALGGTVRPAGQDYVASEFAEGAGEVQMARALSRPVISLRCGPGAPAWPSTRRSG